jgi:hypothetical protein
MLNKLGEMIWIKKNFRIKKIDILEIQKEKNSNENMKEEYWSIEEAEIMKSKS